MIKTRKILINGIVQGVGFRPFIYSLAKKNKINGYISNTPDGVVIEINASDEKLKEFIDDIKNKKPPQSKIESIEVLEVESKKFSSFKIRKSVSGSTTTTLIPSDLAICSDCIKDILDPENRRYLYPFTNCTNCGPRFSIIKKIPYDRKYTTMSCFKMCSKCKNEYENPLDRRFHAQPNACARCGPEVWTLNNGKKIYGDEAIDFIVDKIILKEIVLIKGLGGFHIACDAFNENAVRLLRNIKKRDFKPFAIMVDEVDDILKMVYMTQVEKELLVSSKAPIVMLRKKTKDFEFVAPQIDSVGVMIAYTPLHKIIFRKLKEKGFLNPLVMTSGNLKDEPLIKDNEKAKKMFGGLSILYHNRDIHNRIDDSVCFVDDFNKIRLIRRARGFVPEPIKLKTEYNNTIFAAGADIKNSFAFYRPKEVIMSQYIGDLEIDENRSFYIRTYNNMKNLFKFKPEIALCDMHPDYYSKQITESFGIKKTFYLQHHIAHIFSVMAENNLTDNVIGVAFDGTGYGLDGNIWGGEFFIVKNKKVSRVAHFDYFKLPGGDLVTKQIWRTMASLFYKKQDFVNEFLKEKIDKSQIDIVFKMIDKNINSPLSSSAGRIFDAISVIATGDVFASFEAEGPMKIEKLAYEYTERGYRFDIVNEKNGYKILLDSVIDEIIKDFKTGNNKTISAKFHIGVVDLICNLSLIISREHNIKDICLSGGVFQNRFLVNKLQTRMLKSGLNLYINSLVPSNDGGISLGQIYYHLIMSEKE
ncbi:MAG: carbamoyltransferase HypF [Elusimicrobiota bacterium]